MNEKHDNGNRQQCHLHARICARPRETLDCPERETAKRERVGEFHPECAGVHGAREIGQHVWCVLQRRVRAGRLMFGLCLLVFGAAHFAYAKYTASLVPAWLPLIVAWLASTVRTRW